MSWFNQSLFSNFKVYGLFGFILLMGIGLVYQPATAQTPIDQQESFVPSSTHQAQNIYGQLPITFEANVGQAAAGVDFISRGNGHTLFLMGDEMVLSLAKVTDLSTDLLTSAYDHPDELPTIAVHNLHMAFVGGNTAPQISRQTELAGVSNYFHGNNPSEWHLNVPHYQEIHYQNLYNGIDLVFGSNEGGLQYDFIVAPNINPQTIQMRFDPVQHIALDEQGNLLLHFNDTILRHNAPIIYQMDGREEHQIQGRFRLIDNNTVGFEVGSYNENLPLVIDPTLVYSTFVGGSGAGEGRNIAIDNAGSAYITGFTTSTNYPLQGPVDPLSTGYNEAFVTKLNPAGDGLVYSTYLGGSNGEGGLSITIDGTGAAYITGFTSSPDFPLQNPIYPTHSSPMLGNDSFLTKLNPAGNALIFSTYIGGTGNDVGDRIVLDAAGDIYVAGSTQGTGYPMVNPYDNTFTGDEDCVLTKVNAAGTALVYSTHLGGSSIEICYGLDVDNAGSAYVAGFTQSDDFPLLNAFDPTNGPSIMGMDAFITKFSVAGNTLIYSTYLGGDAAIERAYDILVDATGAAYVTGIAASPDFPLQNPYDATLGYVDAFIAKLNPAGDALIFSTFFGGSDQDIAHSIALDPSGNIYIAGFTESPDFPVLNEIDNTLGGLRDGFVTSFSPNADILLYSTYLGGNAPMFQYDMAYGIAVDATGSAYIGGYTSSSDFPVLNAYDNTLNGSRDPFATKFDGSLLTPILTTSTLIVQDASGDGVVQHGEILTYELSVVNTGGGAANNVVVLDNPPLNTTFNPGSVNIILNTGGGNPIITLGNGALDTSLQINIDTITAGGVVTIQFSITVDDPIPTGMVSIDNIAQISADTIPQFETPLASIPVEIAVDPPVTQIPPIIAIFDPAISKIGELAPGQLGLIGEQIVWTITVSNPSSVAGTNIVIADHLSSSLTIDAITTTIGTASVNGQTVTISIPVLNAGDSVEIRITTTVISGPNEGIIENTVTLNADGDILRTATARVNVVIGLPDTGYRPQ